MNFKSIIERFEVLISDKILTPSKKLNQELVIIFISYPKAAFCLIMHNLIWHSERLSF